MMKEVLRAVETGALAQIGLVAFVVAFVLIVVYAFVLPRAQRDRAKNLPLDDPETTSPPRTSDPESRA